MKLVALLAILFLTTAASSPGPGWRLTPTGLGPVRIGMTRGEVARALDADLSGEALDNEGSCIELFPKSPSLEGTYFLFLDGKLSRISVADPGTIATPRGIRVGSSVADVRKAYGRELEAEAHQYVDLPAQYLTYWLQPDASGVRFETGSEGKVQIIHAGTGSIQLVEGCA